MHVGINLAELELCTSENLGILMAVAGRVICVLDFVSISLCVQGSMWQISWEKVIHSDKFYHNDKYYQ